MVEPKVAVTFDLRGELTLSGSTGASADQSIAAARYAIAGMFHPGSGAVHVDDRVVAGEPGHDLVAVAPQPFPRVGRKQMIVSPVNTGPAAMAFIDALLPVLVAR